MVFTPILMRIAVLIEPTLFRKKELTSSLQKDSLHDRMRNLLTRPPPPIYLMEALTHSTSTLAIGTNTSTRPAAGRDKTTINDGEVLVSKGSGRLKVRKGQTEEEFQEQMVRFSEGPVVNTMQWLEEVDYKGIDPTVKSDRLKLENLAQMLYYKRQYDECLKVVETGLELFKDLPRKRVQTEWAELEYLKEKCTR